MDIIKNKYSFWKRLLHKWQSRKDIPFRKKFFVGYDLYGNTYWEFTIDGNMSRLRRKLQPFRKELFEVDYFKTIPPQWLQWLRRTRDHPPSLNELIKDQLRQEKIKILAQKVDENWKLEKLRLENQQQLKLSNELNKVKLENEKFIEKQKAMGNKSIENPWKQVEQELKNENPIESAIIKPRS